MVGLALSLLAAFVIGAAMVRFGPNLGFVDAPDGFLKPHERPAVPLGGVGVFVAVQAALIVEGRFDEGLLLASSMVFLLGLIDDRFDLSPRIRIAVEIAAGVVLAITADTPALPDGVLGIAVAVVLVVITVNAVNLFDGLDGLAGSSALVAAAGIAVLAAGRGLDSTFGLVLVAALAGFLVWNWYPARLFLGDNGAYTVGIFLVFGFLEASRRGSETDVLIGAGLLGVFALDLVITLLRRRLSGRPLFAGDRSHVYDQLHDGGLGIPQVAVTMATAELGFAIAVVLADRLIGGAWAIVALGMVLAASVAALARLGFLRTA